MIVCIGWGSLIWNPDSLSITNGWHLDGPPVRVEYLRQSNNGRLTLVVDTEAQESTSLWAQMQQQDVSAAKEKLRIREGPTKLKHISSWSVGDAAPQSIPTIPQWAKSVGAISVIWTGLPAEFDGQDSRKPSYEEALAYLTGLPGDVRAEAKEYIERTPPQIRTAYRTGFEKDLGWKRDDKT